MAERLLQLLEAPARFEEDPAVRVTEDVPRLAHCVEPVQVVQCVDPPGRRAEHVLRRAIDLAEDPTRGRGAGDALTRTIITIAGLAPRDQWRYAPAAGTPIG